MISRKVAERASVSGSAPLALKGLPTWKENADTRLWSRNNNKKKREKTPSFSEGFLEAIDGHPGGKWRRKKMFSTFAREIMKRVGFHYVLIRIVSISLENVERKVNGSQMFGLRGCFGIVLVCLWNVLLIDLNCYMKL